jgi:hypothetical protein
VNRISVTEINSKDFIKMANPMGMAVMTGLMEAITKASLIKDTDKEKGF